MDSAQWNKEFGVTSSTPCTPLRPAARPPQDQTLICPRCHSINTKFCYYNNYSLTQPRYLCKTCRRYWTAGGSLRNVPVGGGSRKHNKKYISTTPNDHINSPSPLLPHHQNLKIHDLGQDLNLASEVPHFPKFAKVESKDVIPSSSPSSSITSGSANATHLSALNHMRSGNNINADRGPFITCIPNMVPISSSSLSHHRQTNFALFSPPGFSFRECKPSLASFNGSRYTNSNRTEEDVNGTLMFTLGTTKRHSSTGEGGDHNHQDKGTLENNSNGFWNGMLGGGSWRERRMSE